MGPFTDYVALDKSRKNLRELGFETQVVKKMRVGVEIARPGCEHLVSVAVSSNPSSNGS